MKMHSPAADCRSRICLHASALPHVRVCTFVRPSSSPEIIYTYIFE